MESLETGRCADVRASVRDDQHVEVNLDLLSDKTAKIPISGRYQMDLDEVSLDVLSAVDKYQLSSKRQLKLI